MAQHTTYFFNTYRQFADFVDVGSGTYIAVAAGGLNHCFYTAIVGGCVGYAKTGVSRRHAVWLPIGGLTLASALHILHDYLPSLLQSLAELSAVSSYILIGVLWNVANWAGFVVFVLIVIWSWGKKTLVIREQLADEVRAGVVSEHEYSILASSLRRMAFELEILWNYGLKRWRRINRLHDLEVDLAFHKWHVSRGEPLKGRQRRMGVSDYRETIRSLRESLATDEVRG